MSAITIKRIYEPAAKADGFRVLVDRLWPRGIKKENAHLDEWAKAVAPSDALRKWFNHDPEKWAEFCRRYEAELKENEAVEALIEQVKEHKTVTLLYAAHDEEHNQALVLQKYIHKRLK
ncbi:DUF488 domain-containing protein [Pedobacter sp. BS3]|uniref:DUF488 domain-containing protein n=1 Tax=Pedobacter sp. BS3 TaxID=2567937 RepID=UPI0011F06570|nr:DUF488 domain-containing protein [Pedobacter sp. BS3]TZF84037.1 DUF488 domain-containing protein [Pedobacter sp. BS3]